MYRICEVTAWGLVGEFTGKEFASKEEALEEAERMEEAEGEEYCVWFCEEA